MSERLPTCRETVELVSDYLEDALGPETREHVELHLMRCAGCRTYLEQMRTTVALSGRIEHDSLSDELRKALLEAFRRLPE